MKWDNKAIEKLYRGKVIKKRNLIAMQSWTVDLGFLHKVSISGKAQNAALFFWLMVAYEWEQGRQEGVMRHFATFIWRPLLRKAHLHLQRNTTWSSWMKCPIKHAACFVKVNTYAFLNQMLVHAINSKRGIAALQDTIKAHNRQYRWAMLQVCRGLESGLGGQAFLMKLCASFRNGAI